MISKTNNTAACDTSVFDVARIRQDFPALHQTVNGHPLVYLDNVATSQRPNAVIQAITQFYEHDNANIHRGVHELSMRATNAYEQVRTKVQRFLGAARQEEIIFVRGATEGINLVAQTYGRSNVQSGDEIIVSQMEHHSNIVPWQILCEQTGAVLRVIGLTDAGELNLDEYESLLNDRTKLVAIVHVSNSLGTINPVRKIIELAHRCGTRVLLDGAQAAPHFRVDVAELDCDFYVISGHKMFGPTGIGVLFGKHELLEEMPPYQGGGDMIKSVSFDGTVYNDLPFKFEAGTPNIAGTIGFGAAIDYISATGIDAIAAYEDELLSYALHALSPMPRIRLIGTAAQKVAVVSFVVEGVHAHDVGTILDQSGIAVRTGHHCAQPVMERYGIPATTRASFAFYNTRAEVDALVAGLEEVVKVFG